MKMDRRDVDVDQAMKRFLNLPEGSNPGRLRKRFIA